MTSVIRGDDNFDSAGIVDGTAKAWVNFDGTSNTGGNCDIRASYNVSTVADDGTGQYTVNFATALADANYSVVIYNNAISGTSDTNFNNDYVGAAGSRSTTSVGVASFNPTAFTDSALFDVVIFR